MDRLVYIVGNRIDRDHYNVESIFPIDPKIHPVRTNNRDDVSRWLNRVKTWRVNGVLDFTATIEPGTPSEGSVDLSCSYDLLAPSVCYHVDGIGFTQFESTRERDLIPLTNRGHFISAGIGASGLSSTSFSSSTPFFSPITIGGPPIGSGSMSVSANCSGSFISVPSPFPYHLDTVSAGIIWSLGVPVAWNETEGPAVRLSFFMTMLVVLRANGISPSVQIQATSNYFGSFTTPEPDCIFDGNNVTVKSLTGTSLTSVDSYTISPVTVTPHEFWPFKNRLGQDCYDTSTGAQINNPFA